MSVTLRTLIGNLDSIPERILLWVNVALAGFILIAHGGALAITYSKSTPHAEEIRQLAVFSLPMAAIVIATAAAALVRASLRGQVLSIHGFVFAVSAIAEAFWAFGILLRGIPEARDVTFTWSVGFLSAWVWYSFYVLCRFSLPSALRSRTITFYMPLIALAIAVSIDLGVFVRLISSDRSPFWPYNQSNYRGDAHIASLHTSLGRMSAFGRKR